jgi:hypothetical protein
MDRKPIRRARIKSRTKTAPRTRARKQDQSVKAHPLIGALKGTVRIAPGTDLTQPADPEWGKLAWGDGSEDQK